MKPDFIRRSSVLPDCLQEMAALMRQWKARKMGHCNLGKVRSYTLGFKQGGESTSYRVGKRDRFILRFTVLYRIIEVTMFNAVILK